MPRPPKRRLFAGVLLLALSLSAPAWAVAPKPPLHLLGSTTLLPIVQPVAERYMREHPEQHIVISGGGTYRGYKALVDGTADIAMASSLPSEQTLAVLGEGVHTIESTTVAYVAMVPIVHPRNPLTNLTMSQLHDIFIGHIDNMKHLGGGDVPIKVLIGSPSDGLTESWRMTVVGETGHHTPKVEILDAKERIKRVHADPGAISFIADSDANDRVKVLTVNGIAADQASVRGGRYILDAPLILATTKHAPAAAKNFIAYFLEATKDLNYDGFIPAGAAPTQSAAKP